MVARRTTKVARGAESVFAFVSDGANDPRWRSGVYNMEVGHPVAPAGKWRESSLAFKFFRTITPLVVKEFDAQKRVVLETSANHVPWRRHVREVVPMSGHRTLLIYELSFDAGWMPGEFVAFWLGRRIARDLEKARSVLEAERSRKAP